MNRARYDYAPELLDVLRVLRCKRCGHIEIGWSRQENTEQIDLEE